MSTRVPTQPCLYTKVRNISHSSRTFSFLPPHGRILTPGQEAYIKGDLATRLATDDRKFGSLVTALTNQELAIVSTPAVHLFDPTTDNTKVLKVTAGVLGIADPCWGGYHSVGY